MKKQKYIIYFLLAIMILATLFAGCNSAAATQNTTENNETEVKTNTYDSTSQSGEITSEVTNIEAEYSGEDIDSSYAEDDAVIITLNDERTNIEGAGASYKNGTVTITRAGTYILTGSLKGQIIVEATSVDEVQIVLNGAEIINENGAAIYIKQAEKVTLTLADDTENYIEDGNSYEDTSEDAPDSAVYSDDALVINGSGTLQIKGNYKHGIKCSDDITIISGTINIEAANDGIRGKDSVSILDGIITIDAVGDGITSTNADDEDKGWISIDGGVFIINALNNGFQTESALNINAGEINVTAGQDTYHSNNDILVAGGLSLLKSGDDGMHADNILQITAGTIEIASNYEGIEGSDVYISGGKISVEAVDDGINAAGGTDNTMPAGDRFNMDRGSHIISITGGDIYISCIGSEGDGLDSNGDIYISGGNVTIDGAVSRMDTAIDIDAGTFQYTGGSLAAVGSTSMLVIPETQQQPVITIVFNSNQQGGNAIKVTDESGNEVISFVPEKTYAVAMLSSPALAEGETYTVYSGSDKLFSITLNSTSVTVDENGNETAVSGTGGRMPGQDGGKPGRDEKNPPR